MNYFIDEIKVMNLKHTKLYIKGWALEEKFTINIYCGKELFKVLTPNRDRSDVCSEYKTQKNKNCGFEYSIILPNLKKIVVFLETKHTKIKLYSFNNNNINNFFRKRFKKTTIALTLFKKGASRIWKDHKFVLTPALINKYSKSFINKIRSINDYDSYCYKPYVEDEYHQWLVENKTKEKYFKFDYTPLISIIVPVYNISKKYLSECIDSVLNQQYENWELCLCDDKSTNPETIDCLKEYAKKDKRIKIIFRNQNGHISNASNSALKIAKGEFVALLDNDDVITKDALYQIVKVLNKNKDLDLIYSDEDKLSPEGELCYPNFKPDWSPDMLMSHNYICHFTILRKSIVDKIDGFKIGLEGAQDFDLFLRFTEQTGKIYHIARILYHWRMIPGSTSMDISSKSYVTLRGQQALEDALKRKNIKGKVIIHGNNTYYTVNYSIVGHPKISIIISTGSNPSFLNKCLKSIYDKTTYKNFEIIINNINKSKEVKKIYEEFKTKYENIYILDIPNNLNYAALNNEAVKISKGKYLVLLSDTIEVITANWLELMLGHALQDHVGAVGAKLLYSDNTIQNCGSILGIRNKISYDAFSNKPHNASGVLFKTIVPSNYSVITSNCLMINKQKYLKIDGLEEKLMCSYYDVDFCLKLSEENYYNVILPEVKLYNHKLKFRSKDLKNKKKLISDNNLIFKKWEDKIKNDPFYNQNYSKKSLFLLDIKKRK